MKLLKRILRPLRRTKAKTTNATGVGAHVEVMDTITTDLRVVFDPAMYPPPRTPYWHAQQDFCRVNFRTRKRGVLTPGSHTWKIDDEMREIAASLVEDWIEENPREDWPSRMQEHFDGRVYP